MLTAPAGGAAVGHGPIDGHRIGQRGVVGVQFKRDTTNIGAEDTSAPYAVSWNTTTVANGSYALTAVARDAGGNTTTSTIVTVTVNNADTTAPTVSITAPSNNAREANTVTVSANASDNVGVVAVQFKVDGTNIGAEDTTAPYSVSWNTATVSNGNHVLTAVAERRSRKQHDVQRQDGARLQCGPGAGTRPRRGIQSRAGGIIQAR